MIKPGDIVEWAHKETGDPVVKDEELWSSVTKSWCLIGSGLVHTCIACDGETITWLNSKGLFFARVDDASIVALSSAKGMIIPRVKK
jgi:hypothetical protein